MSDVQPSTDSAVISGGLDKPSRKKQYILIAVAIAILLVLGAAAFVRVQQDLRVSRDNDSFAAATKQSLALRGNKQYDQAIGVLKDYISGSSNQQHKAYAYISIANVYETEQNNQQALVAYKNAQAAGAPAYAADIGIARASYALGDKATAVKYYKLCIAYLQQHKGASPTSADDVASLQSTIEQIEAQQ